MQFFRCEFLTRLVPFVLTAASCTGDGPSGETPGTARAAVTASASHRRCGWIGLGNYEDGVASFSANTAYFEAIHPVWYQIGADSVSVVAFSHAGDPRVVGTTAQLEPTIEDSGSAAVLRTLINDPAKRQAHIANLVALVQTAGYVGLDVDYEHLWTKADRPGYEAFVTELVAAMHAQGKELSVTIPGLAVPDVDSAYDYVDLAASGADHFHIM